MALFHGLDEDWRADLQGFWKMLGWRAFKHLGGLH